MRVSAKGDYAIRALVELASRLPGHGTEAVPVKGDDIASAQQLPVRFCENILGELRAVGWVGSRRGSVGGYWLRVDPAALRLGDVIRVIEGPLAAVRGERPTEVDFPGAAAPLQSVWVAARAALRGVLDNVTIADVVEGLLPGAIVELLEPPQAWVAVVPSVTEEGHSHQVG